MSADLIYFISKGEITTQCAWVFSVRGDSHFIMRLLVIFYLYVKAYHMSMEAASRNNKDVAKSRNFNLLWFQNTLIGNVFTWLYYIIGMFIWFNIWDSFPKCEMKSLNVISFLKERHCFFFFPSNLDFTGHVTTIVVLTFVTLYT